MKCIRCGSENTFLNLANEDPDKFGYRCRDCIVSWSKSEADASLDSHAESTH